MSILVISIGGFLGAVCRFLISGFFQKSTKRFPYGTFIVNTSGTFLLGYLFGCQIEQTWMLLLGTGFCGAFTTFSTIQWETFQLKQDEQTQKMIFYLALTYITGFFMALLGYYMGKIITS